MALHGDLTRELPYWTIRNGAVILRDGSYRLGFEITLPTTEVWDAIRLTACNERLRLLLGAAVPEGECLRILLELHADYEDTLRSYAGGCRSDHPVVRAVHQRRVAALSDAHVQGRLVNSRLLFDLSYHPRPRPRRSWWRPIDAETLQRHLAELRILRDLMLGHCERCGFRARALDDDGLLTAIWRYFNPDRKRYCPPPAVPTEDQVVEIPRRLLRSWSFLSRRSVRTAVLRSDLYRRWDFLWLDGCAHAVVAMDTLPDKPTTPNVLGPLQLLSGAYWLVIEIWNDPRSDQIKRLELKSRLSRQAVLAQDGGDSNARAVERQVSDALDMVQLTGEHVVRAGVAVVLQEASPEGVRAAARRAVDAFHQVPGVDARIESVALRRQFLRLAPFSGQANERLMRMLTSNAADFVPCHAQWHGSARPICPWFSRRHSLVTLDPFDPRLPSWNAVVVGESGGGKTHFAIAWLSHLLALDPVIMVVDKGGAYKPFCEVYGGQYVHLDPEGGVSINPFDLLPGEQAPDHAHVGLLKGLIAMMVADPGEDIGRRELAVLESAIRQAYARAAGAPVFLHDLVRTLRTFEQVGGHGAVSEDWTLAQGIATRLEPWIDDGVYARLLDRPSSVDLDASIVCLDTEGLSEHYPDLVPIVAQLANHVIYRRVRADDGRLKYVVSDETWASLLNRVAAESLVGMFRRFRKFGAGVMAISQRVQDFENEFARGILENAPLKVLTRAADVDRVAPLLDLNDQCRALWKGLTQVRGAYSEALVLMDTLEGREGGVVVVRDIPEDYFIATTTAEERARRDRLAAEVGVWPAIQQLADSWRRSCTQRG